MVPSTVAFEADESVLADVEAGETLSFHLVPWRLSRCLETLTNKKLCELKPAL